MTQPTPAVVIGDAAGKLREHAAYVRRLGITTAAGALRPNRPEVYEGFADLLERAQSRLVRVVRVAELMNLPAGWDLLDEDDEAALALAQLVLGERAQS